MTKLARDHAENLLGCHHSAGHVFGKCTMDLNRYSEWLPYTRIMSSFLAIAVFETYADQRSA
jgi:hypothetical protein